MSKKTNLITQKRYKNEKNLFYADFKKFIYLNKFLNNFDDLLSYKNFITTSQNFNISNSNLYFSNNIFINHLKLTQYKKRFKKIKKAKDLRTKKFLQLFKAIALKEKLSKIIINLKFLNKYVEQSHYTFLSFSLKKYKNSSLFYKKENLFSDFISLTILFTLKKINIKTYLNIFVKIFQTLIKKQHGFFFQFLEFFFKLLIIKYNKFLKKNSKNQADKLYFKGFKFLIFGKLKGKTRASKHLIKIGRTPLQSIDKKIFFAQQPAFTTTGTFGINLWVYSET